jgi:hypothetical protein
VTAGAARWGAGLAFAAFGAFVVFGALGACGRLTPDVGPPLAGDCEDTDGNPAVHVSFATQIRPILSRPMAGCGCHVPSGASAGPATQITGLDLSSLSSLRAGGHNTGNRIVIPLQPCESLLYQKVDEAPPFGSRMPLGGPYLTEEQIDLIHDWIAEGALDN